MAVNLLRQFGFKLHLHWMPNLYGSDPERDKKDYLNLFQDPDFMPDELKIYPCSLIPKTPLAKIYEQGLWHPYNRDELLDLLSFCFTHTPRYCRLSRVIRDIPSQEIVVGNKMTNFRQLVDQKIKQSGLKVEEIRSRELNRQQFNLEDLALNLVSYHTSVSDEVFMEYIDSQDKISGFLRLSFPLITPPLKELTQSAIIRELHVYGQSTPLGVAGKSAQHRGLGKKLIEAAIEQSHLKKYQKLSVISAVGTRDYYRRLGFIDGELYQHYELN